MANNFKKSLTILQHEFRLQIYTAGSILIFFALSLALAKAINPVTNELPKLFIVFYTVIIGLALPWQMNTKGHIEPGYCRYHLSLPVQTWQLYILPLIFRLMFIFIFVGVEFLLYRTLYEDVTHYYINIENLWYYTRISILIYFVLQMYAWIKDSFKNMFFYLAIAVTICTYFKPSIIPQTIETPYFFILVLLLAALAIIGVRNLRFGTILELPGLQSIFSLMKKDKHLKEKTFTDKVSTQFHYEWKRTWFFMPGFTIFYFIMVYYFSRNMYADNGYYIYVLYRNLQSIAITFILITLILPVLGIMYIDASSYKSTFVNHLPISSKELGEIKIKCFSYSFAICLGLFFAWLGFKLFIFNNNLLQLLNYQYPQLMQSPIVIIWFIAGLMILGFTFAFFIAVSYMKYRLMSALLALLLILIYLYSKRIQYIYLYGFLRQYGIYDIYLPWYLPAAIMICLMLTLKIALFYLINKSFVYKIACLVGLSVACIIFVLLANQYVFITIGPFILLFVYPVMAQKQKITQQRHELGYKHIALPWKLIKIVTIVFIAFSIYTYVIDRLQKKELNAIIEQATIVRPQLLKRDNNINIEQYISMHIPNKTKTWKTLSKKLNLSNTVFKTRTTAEKVNRMRGITINYMTELIRKSINHRQYAKAFQYSIFNLDIYERFYSGGNYRFSFTALREIFKNYTPPSEELSRLNVIQTKILHRNLSFGKQQLYDLLIKLKKPNLIEYHDANIFFRKSRKGVFYFNDFGELYLSPLQGSFKISYAKSLKDMMNSIDYLLSLKHNKEVLSWQVNRDTINRVYNYGIQKIQKHIIITSMVNYRGKYGKYPVKLRYLVPEFLNERELYIYLNKTILRYDYNKPFSKKHILTHASKDDILRDTNYVWKYKTK